jgi:hypothetical protein
MNEDMIIIIKAVIPAIIREIKSCSFSISSVFNFDKGSSESHVLFLKKALFFSYCKKLVIDMERRLIKRKENMSLLEIDQFLNLILFHRLINKPPLIIMKVGC